MAEHLTLAIRRPRRHPGLTAAAMAVAVIGVSANRAPQSTGVTAASSTALVEQFKDEPVFWKQFDIAKAIVAMRETSVLPALANWLTRRSGERVSEGVRGATGASGA